MVWNDAGVFEPLTDKIFTNLELTRVLRKLKEQTSPGPDLVPSFVIKNKSSAWHSLLLNILNKIFVKQAMPAQWTQAKLIPIYKEGLPTSPNNYRPIAVINLVTKV